MIAVWNKHKKTVITSAQVMTVVTMLAGIIGNHYSNTQNSEAIGSSTQWMKDAIKLQTTEIVNLRIDNAVLKTKYDTLKERVEADEALIRGLKK